MLKRWREIILGGYWLALFIATHMPVPQELGGMLEHNFDKLLHLGVYAILAFLWSNWRHSISPWNMQQTWWGIFILGAYGIADELIQIPTGRSAELKDWLSDLLGVIVGFALFFACLRSVRKEPATEIEPSSET